MTDLE